TTSDSESTAGWTVGGGLIVYVQKHVGLKGDVRYYHSFEATDLLGFNIGGGLIVYVQKHVGLKGDVRYYHSFEATDLLGFDIGGGRNKIDFGRAAFGVVFKF